MDADSSKVLHFTQVQVGDSPDTRTSPEMEKAGFVRGLSAIRSQQLTVAAITTDRHVGIRKHVREQESGLEHELDSWHVVKGVRKKLQPLAKKADCNILQGWIQPICNHLYFSVCMSENDKALWLNI
ncbi:uncharacterized protein LOC119391782 [Rhipicephalus sanguineus]|uniref:uncharacterized protein LOC119391782 n=1 Tax=Rhipicephalus sanguineus TaxID=34632 RepID=UPI001895BEDF|nr:uncharacterized protein LOC119391782 [Rhipicephalus sanguineus]